VIAALQLQSSQFAACVKDKTKEREREREREGGCGERELRSAVRRPQHKWKLVHGTSHFCA